MSARAVSAALRDVEAVYACLKPHEQKELFRLLLHRVEVGEREIVLEIYAGASATPAPAPDFTKSVEQRSGTPIWLPGLVPQSVIRDVSQVRLPSVARMARAARRQARVAAAASPARPPEARAGPTTLLGEAQRHELARPAGASEPGG